MLLCRSACGNPFSTWRGVSWRGGPMCSHLPRSIWLYKPARGSLPPPITPSVLASVIKPILNPKTDSAGRIIGKPNYLHPSSPHSHTGFGSPPPAVSAPGGHAPRAGSAGALSASCARHSSLGGEGGGSGGPLQGGHLPPGLQASRDPATGAPLAVEPRLPNPLKPLRAWLTGDT
jgi:hypothetical protein